MGGIKGLPASHCTGLMLLVDEVNVVVVLGRDLGVLAEEVPEHPFLDHILKDLVDILLLHDLLGLDDLLVGHQLMLEVLVDCDALDVGQVDLALALLLANRPHLSEGNDNKVIKAKG